MYEWLGICLALAALLTFNAAASLLASASWRLLQSRAKNWPAKTQAQTLFALRVFPGLAAFICVLTLLLPAYLIHEPRHKAEQVSLKLGALALISAVGLLLALWRGLAAWIVTRNLVKNWLSKSVPVKLPQTSVPAYRLSHPFPVIAVVGLFRPKLFIADYLFDLLTPEELSAAVEHECGHIATRDNLKRTLLRICRDVLAIVPCGRGLDREWAAASEAAADDFAARKGSEVALDLASALVKIARMVPAGIHPTLPVSAFLIGENLSSIKFRVGRLAQQAGSGCGESPTQTSPIAFSLWLSFGILLLSALAVAADTNSLFVIHHLIEIAVSSLQ